MWIDILRGKEPWRTPVWSLFRGALWLLSVPYACLMRLRRWAYRKGVLPSRTAKKNAEKTAPSRSRLAVISVGNITTGGTGKTPMVAWIVRELQAAGRRPGVVLRGYKSREGKSDEAELLKQLTGAIVVTNADRVAGADQAVAAGADVIVLDDAFQHMRLRRDLDIVLIDATDPFGLGHCLPRGLLREPPSALSEAEVIVITRSDAIDRTHLAKLRETILRYAPRAQICLATHRPLAAIDSDGQRQDPAVLAGRKVFAFCGIGNPGSFLRTLERTGASIVGVLEMDDHCAYPNALLEKLSDLGRKSGAESFVTTQKDGAKIDPAKLTLPMYQLAIEMELTEGHDKFQAIIRSTVL